MKIALALLLLIVPAFAADSNPKAEKEVSAAMAAWKTAMTKGDATALGKLYHPDLIYTHSTAKDETKAEAIENACAPTGIAKSIDLRDVVTHIYGSTAIVKAKGDFVSHDGTMNHLDVVMVWLKGPQGWQLLARQATKLP
jgi:ketosteroid isomerase-like protein